MDKDNNITLSLAAEILLNESISILFQPTYGGDAVNNTLYYVIHKMRPDDTTVIPKHLTEYLQINRTLSPMASGCNDYAVTV